MRTPIVLAALLSVSCSDPGDPPGRDAAPPGAADATAGDADAGITHPPRPVLLTTDAELDRAKARAADPASPFHQAWLSVETQAGAALEREFSPQEPDSTEEYYYLANPEARAIHALAVAYRVSGEPAYLQKAREALMAWATFCNADLPADDPTPSWRDFGYPGKVMPHSAGLHISRVLVIFADAYAMLYPELSEPERAEIERWFSSMRSPIQRSTQLWETADHFHSAPGVVVESTPPWFGRQDFNNHLGAHVLGQLAIGYATGNDALVEYASSHPDNPRDLREMFEGVLLMPGDELQRRDPTLGSDDDRFPDPLPGEVYDRYRVRSMTGGGDRGLIYTSLGQRFLALAAEMQHNNGAAIDDWRFVAPGGENLRDSYAVYAPFQSAPDDATACRGRYHEGSAGGGNIARRWRAMTEMAFREYPYDPAIRAVVRTASARNYDDSETFGASAPLLDGELLDPPGGPTWRHRSAAGGEVSEPVATASGADTHFLGDWDGDGVDTPGWRTGAVFYLSNSPTGAGATAHPFGKPCDDALVGDWDGDGKDSIGVRRGKTFYLSNGNVEADILYSAGRRGDRVIVGDWDGDGVDTPGLVRGTGLFLRADNTADAAFLPYFELGQIGDRFVAGDWDGDGVDTPAAVRETGDGLTWHLRGSNDAGDATTTAVELGQARDGVAAGNVSGDAADELAAIRYR